MKSPLTILYADLIDYQKRQVHNAQAFYDGNVKRGEPNNDGSKKRLECAKRILKLLEKSNRQPQTDLFALNETINNK